MKKIFAFVIALLMVTTSTVFAASENGMIGINVLTTGPVTQQILDDLGQHGKVRDVIPEIKLVTLQAKASELAVIQAKPYVAAANPDAERQGAPVGTVSATDYADGLSTWDLDSINVTDFGFDNRQVGFDGSGVFVAVLDTGLVHIWRQYFPQERIATELAMSFGGGGGDMGWVSSQPNKWERDTNSHGTHVTSTILGYNIQGTPINGVAPMVKVIPVKVLNQNGSGWSSVIARGIVYVANLKLGPLAEFPVVINMSLGGSVLDAGEKAAIDYAIDAGVIIVASAGNRGTRGMGYPGAYAPVISVAASGWTGEWAPVGNNGWWWNVDIVDPTDPADFYITDFSSRAKAGQDLDVAAPGSWVLGPYKTDSSNFPTYYYLGGTSMASPHVAGIAALMVQKNPSLVQWEVENYLELSAIPLSPGCRDVLQPSGLSETFCWDADATGAGLATADAALSLVP